MEWYAVRCIFEWDCETYEERITLWRCASIDEAIELAENEATEYVVETNIKGYLGLAQAFRISSDRPESGDEVFSLIRHSKLRGQDYVSMYFDTGTERNEGS